jgi:hypothetical protein
MAAVAAAVAEAESWWVCGRPWWCLAVSAKAQPRSCATQYKGVKGVCSIGRKMMKKMKKKKKYVCTE